ncbi:hypothetical protein GCM10009101_24940 [Brevundimonas lenta]
MHVLVVVAAAGQAVAYALSVMLARSLGAAGFEAYVVASAAFIVMASFAPLGSDKHVLSRLPGLLQRGDWSQASGLLRFGARRTLATALVTGAVVGGLSWSMRDPGDAVWPAMVVTCLSLPAGALAHYGVEALSAAGRPLRALALFKLLTPVLALVLAGMLMLRSVPLTGAAAVGCWGVAWVVTLGAMIAALRRAAPQALSAPADVGEAAVWRVESRPFFVYRVSLAILAQAGVIGLELMQASAAAIGAYAAASATVGVAAVLATSTNRAYGRKLSLLMEQGDFEAVMTARRERLRRLGPAVIVFLLAIFVFSRPLLAMFRPEFAAEGVAALRILAVATGVTVLFSLAPTWLKIRQRRGVIYAAVAVAAAVQVVLLIVLIPPFGATGAALAYALCVGGMYGVLAVVAHREAMRLGGVR